MKVARQPSGDAPNAVLDSLLRRMQAPPPARPPYRRWPAGWFLVSVLAGLGLAVLGTGLLLVAGTTPPPSTASAQAGEPGAGQASVPAPQAIPLVGCFRGDPARRGRARGDYAGRPLLLWRYPRRPMCAHSRVGRVEKTWCGTGWTGQPALWRRADGVREVVFGAFDRRVHFVDLRTGRASRPAFATADIIKGSVTLDPDGEPLLYFGSRDDRLRILALDRPRARELWSLDANAVGGIWNNDWDGNPLVRGDLLIEGGENGYLFVFKLNRDYDEFGRVAVSPETLLAYPAWTDSLLKLVGDQNASIEGSVAAFGDRIYFANSAGRVMGLDLSQVQDGQVRVVFDFWMGDDVDASVAIDEQGMLYVAAEQERYLPRAEVVGQLVKLNPYHPADPILWSVKVPPGFEDWRGGIWASPALGAHSLFVVTQSGLLLEVAREDGRILASDRVGSHAWSSPVLAHPWLIVATCRGEIRCYRVGQPGLLELAWQVEIPSRACIESTPLVWNGYIVVGARDGYVYAFGRQREAVAGGWNPGYRH